MNTVEPRAAVMSEGAEALVGDIVKDDQIESMEAMVEGAIALCDCPPEHTGRVEVSLDVLDRLGDHRDDTRRRRAVSRRSARRRRRDESPYCLPQFRFCFLFSFLIGLRPMSRELYLEAVEQNDELAFEAMVGVAS